MRRLLLAVPFLIPLCAQAQTTAANPVEPFSYGVRAGTAKNPFVAALSSVVPSAQAGSTQAAMPVEMFSYGRRIGTQSNPIYVNLGNALDGYVTRVSLNSTLAEYLPKAGGTVQNLTVAASFTAPSSTYAKATSSTCAAGQIYYISDGQKFWSGQAFTSGSSSVYPATGTGQGGGFYGCAPGQSGALTLLPLLMNYSGGSAQ